MALWRAYTTALIGLVLGGFLGNPAFADARFANPQDGRASIAALERDGRSYCKATLLDSRLAMTAAHCVQDPDAKAPDPRAVLVFPDGRRIRVSAAATAPNFFYNSHAQTPITTILNDVAIVALDVPSPAPAINLFRFDPDSDGWVLVPDKNGDWERCPTKSWPGGVVFWVGCTREPGESGTPVLRVESDGTLNAVGVLVAQASTGGLFAHAVAPTLPALVWVHNTEGTPQ